MAQAHDNGFLQNRADMHNLSWAQNNAAHGMQAGKLVSHTIGADAATINGQHKTPLGRALRNLFSDAELASFVSVERALELSSSEDPAQRLVALHACKLPIASLIMMQGDTDPAIANIVKMQLALYRQGRDSIEMEKFE